MCGITAYVGEDGASRSAEVDGLAARLRHRGPDGAGLVRCGAAVLAHRRLSIIDVAGGGQPLAGEKGRVSLVCNGEIYNHRSLRSRLEERHAFSTRTDSEVIVHLYEEMGASLVHELDGMFAFVLTDGDEVLAARDPLGIKPLYFARDARGGLWFASELKALPDECSEVRELPAGCLYTRATGVRRWFSPSWSEEPPEQPRPFRPEVVAARLGAAVEKRLMSDVPLGVFLSGGLDSSLVASLVRPHVDELHSFAVGTPGSPDLEAARTVARHLDTVHHEYVYTAGEVRESLPDVVRHLESYDAPLIRSSVPCYFLSRLTSDHVKVVLSGEGSDEAFAGYLYFRDAKDAAVLHRETVRILDGLHNMNLQRVDRMTMAHSLEARVPFLDIDFLQEVMALDPGEKLHRPGRPEKWLLRRSFDGALPDSILWREKQEFAQGSGAEAVLASIGGDAVTDADLLRARKDHPVDTPTTTEELLYRRLFEEAYPSENVRSTVGRWRGAFAPPALEEEAHA